MNLEKAKQLSHEAYDSIGLKRKWGNLHYHVHTDEVASLGQKHCDFDEEMTIAAYLHDLCEEVSGPNKYYDLAWVFDNFGFRVAALVRGLTDMFTKEAFPNMDREQRKKNEAIRLSLETRDVKLVKLCDIVSNTKDIVQNAPGFAVQYLKEKRYILDLFAGSDPTLVDETIYKMAVSQIS